MARIPWYMTTETYSRYEQIFDELFEAAQAQDNIRYNEARERLRALPGFPHGMHPDLDIAVPVLRDTSSTITVVGSKQ